MRMYLCIDGGRILDRKAQQFRDSNSPRGTVPGDRRDGVTSYYTQIEGLNLRFLCQINKIEDRAQAAIANKASTGMYSLRVGVTLHAFSCSFYMSVNRSSLF